MTPSSKIVLITGGSRGLGRSTALMCARKGLDCILTWHSKEAEAARVVAEIEALGGRAVALQLDTGNVSAFPAFTEALKKTLHDTWQRSTFDALVNNAGVGSYNSLAETTEDQFDTLMNIHFKGVFFLTQSLMPLIEDGGQILNVSSGLARFALPGYGAYAAMKGAVEVLTRYLARELGPRRIAVNTIAPGAIATDFGGGRVRDDADLNRMVAGMTAMGRVGLPDDIGGAVSTILAGDMGWMTGQRLEISGGQLL
ncbi:SDR family NAD(P)-dependent oxidoreductase [Roseibium aestuarii]|uniref:SDR family NAD(P)-dependent oxidoreductase n=1 Tax=Roseibium aestuarii TaxID=2600299 RepID=A0ABW4JWN0_9HYPH|nr:SDR family oxidoreductase [Roseibium aestuarii]